MEETTQDLANKKARITKLGTPILVWGKIRGALLGENADGTFRVSVHDSGSNWVDNVHIDKIEVDDGVYREPNKKNEYIEIEEAGCEGGACKI